VTKGRSLLAAKDRGSLAKREKWETKIFHDEDASVAK
jgi:hypothetical protein